MSKKLKLNDTSKVMFEYYKGEGVPKNVTHVRFHPSVVNVDNEAFQGRNKLREVVLDNSLRGIGNGAFSGCHSLPLQSINIPLLLPRFVGLHLVDGDWEKRICKL